MRTVKHVWMKTRRSAGRFGAGALAMSSVAFVLAAGGCAHDKTTLLLDAPVSQRTALDISNPFGSVTVTVDPDADEIEIESRIKDNEAVEQNGDDDIPAVRVEAETISQGTGASVTHIEVVPNSANAATAQVALEVTVPSCDGVRVSAAGDVVLDGVAGAISVETTSGSIAVRTGAPVHNPVSLFTTHGDIVLALPSTSQGLLDVQTPLGMPIVRSNRDRLSETHAEKYKYTGVLNNSDNPITLRTGHGDARITVGNAAKMYLRIFH